MAHSSPALWVWRTATHPPLLNNKHFKTHSVNFLLRVVLALNTVTPTLWSTLPLCLCVVYPPHQYSVGSCFECHARSTPAYSWYQAIAYRWFSRLGKTWKWGHSIDGFYGAWLHFRRARVRGSVFSAAVCKIQASKRYSKSLSLVPEDKRSCLFLSRWKVLMRS